MTDLIKLALNKIATDFASANLIPVLLFVSYVWIGLAVLGHLGYALVR